MNRGLPIGGRGSIRNRHGWIDSATLAALLACALLPAPVFAQAVLTAPPLSIAENGTTCAGDRGGTGCTAGEFTIGATFVADAGTAAFCKAGEEFTFQAELSLSGSNADRYDVGFFVSEDGAPATGTGGSCSVATFSAANGLPFFDDGDACGDLKKLGADLVKPVVQGLTVTCGAADPTLGSQLAVPYALTWDINTSGTCTSALDVAPAGTSKCQKGDGAVAVTVKDEAGADQVLNVQVGGYVTVTHQSTPDGEAQEFNSTATGPVGSTVAV